MLNRRGADPAHAAERNWLTPKTAKAESALDALLGEPVFAAASGLRTSDAEWLFRQLGATIGSGIPATIAMGLLADAQEGTPTGALCAELTDALAGGAPLSAALAARPDTFSPAVRALIDAGESTGTLPTALESAADLLHADLASLRNLKRAVTYPLIAAAAIGSLTAVLALVATPLLTSAMTGTHLPAVTAAMLVAARFAPLLIVPAALAALALAAARRASPTAANVQARMERWALRAPGYRTIVRHRAHARLASSLGRLLAAGLVPDEALRLAAPTTGNAEYTAAAERAAHTVSAGAPLSDALANEPLYSGMFANLLRAAEASAALPDLLRRYAETADRDGARASQALADAAEPAATAVIAVVLVAWLGAVLLPVLSASAALP